MCNELTEGLDILLGVMLALLALAPSTISNCLETFVIALISKHRICKNSVKLRTATHKDNMETEVRLRAPEQAGTRFRQKQILGPIPREASVGDLNV